MGFFYYSFLNFLLVSLFNLTTQAEKTSRKDVLSHFLLFAQNMNSEEVHSRNDFQSHFSITHLTFCLKICGTSGRSKMAIVDLALT